MTIRFDTSVSKAVDLTASTQVATATAADAPAAPVMPEANELLFSGDPGAMLAALTMVTAKNEEKVSRQGRDEALDAQEKSERAEIQDLHDKANLQRAQGFFDGAMQIGKGLCDMGAGFDEASEAGQSGQAAADEADIKQNGSLYSPDRVDALQSSANELHQGAAASHADAAGCKGAGSAFSAGQSIGDGLFQGAITDKDADEKAHEASGDTFKRIADDAHDSENDAKQLMTKALDFYKEYVDTKNQTVMAALRRA
jgi:hypothetical protein